MPGLDQFYGLDGGAPGRIRMPRQPAQCTPYIPAHTTTISTNHRRPWSNRRLTIEKGPHVDAVNALSLSLSLSHVSLSIYVSISLGPGPGPHRYDVVVAGALDDASDEVLEQAMHSGDTDANLNSCPLVTRLADGTALVSSLCFLLSSGMTTPGGGGVRIVHG